MQALRKKLLVLTISAVGVLGLFNVSVQFGAIMDFFPGVNVSLLLAEEITETENSGSASTNNNYGELVWTTVKDGYVLHTLLVTSVAEIYLHTVNIPMHPAFEKVTPPPKA